MKKFIWRRLLLLLPTLFGALSLVFLLVHLIPGDPVEVMLGETASGADKQELRRALGLDKPLATQYRTFLTKLAAGDLGSSLFEQASVSEIIGQRLPATLELALCAMIAALAISFPLAFLAARRPGSSADRMALLFSLLGLSLPNFWLGPLLMIVFSIQLGWLPVSGRGGPLHVILPAFTLGLGMAAILTRMLRASLLQVARTEFVQTARAKGLSEKSVWLKHMLRNALLPVVTIMSLQFGALLAGSLITETVFSWPGIGRLTVQAIQTRDYPLVQGCVLVIAVAYVLVNFFTDIIYKWVDPRVSYGD
ncbi:MAG TPA: ABC transporter permease [Candidatus Limnocylindria bacterium]|nr:ABC transporter permease [Candidatus Limnocylindria bacterium]